MKRHLAALPLFVAGMFAARGVDGLLDKDWEQLILSGCGTASLMLAYFGMERALRSRPELMLADEVTGL